ncbi:uncharacterized protein LOC136075353 [Hydra vulgaris]|uniref:Uncharacterized protein LOC136075353 n=1 Tax=Hydra vulgaris TaxID=6087 RepID=A0ABM4B643_HYDVU
MSTVNLPLFNEPNSMLVIAKCPHPELHLIQGFVNHVFWNRILPLLGREKAMLWPLKLKLISKNYQGEVFEGNAFRKLLQHADKLLEADVLGKVSPLLLLPLVSLLKTMDNVVKYCFGTAKVSHNLSHYLQVLKTLFQATYLSETLKMHIIFKYIEQCLCELKSDYGLGLVSEQARESIHREFLKYWSRYQINIITDVLYGEQLMKAVVKFSLRHL